MKEYFVLILLIILSSCTYYSTATRPESEKIINAPIDVVWEKTLQILHSENITIKLADKNSYSILARKGMSLWSIADDITIQLIPKDENQTIMHFSSETKNLLIGWGHEKRLVLDIFNKIKIASEQ
jgi:uncharacterized protein YpmB